MPIGIICKVCNKIIQEHTRAGVYVGKLYSPKFCSEDCKKDWIILEKVKKKKRGCHSYYINKKIKDQIMSKFNSACYFCNSTIKLRVHHILPFLNGGSSKLNNLCLACSDCHRILEDKSSTQLKKWITRDYDYKLNPKFMETRIIMFEKLKELRKDLRVKIYKCDSCNRFHTKIYIKKSSL